MQRSPFIPKIFKEIKNKPRMLLEIHEKSLKENIFKISPKTFRQLIQFIQLNLCLYRISNIALSGWEKTINHLEKLRNSSLKNQSDR